MTLQYYLNGSPRAVLKAGIPTVAKENFDAKSQCSKGKAQTKQVMQPAMQGARCQSHVEVRVNT